MDIDEFTDIVVDIQSKDIESRNWTDEENNILRRWHGHLLDEQIGELLGRSRIAVQIHWKRDLHLPAPSTDLNYVSARKIAELLGIDNHVTPYWIDSGILSGEYIPRRDNQLHRRVPIGIFLEWVTNPSNWIWFNIHKIANRDIKDLVEKKAKEWGDEWWTTNQVAAHHSVHNKDVLRFINAGRIQAIQARNRGGRNGAHWANWFILRSEAIRSDLKFKRNGKYKKSSLKTS